MRETVLQRLEQVAERHEEIERLLADPDVIADHERFRSLSQEYAQTSELVKQFGEWRQAQADLSILVQNVPQMDINGDGVSDFDGSNINFVGQSLGSIVGTGFLAVEPNVNNAVLSVPGGGIANLLLAGEFAEGDAPGEPLIEFAVLRRAFP